MQVMQIDINDLVWQVYDFKFKIYSYTSQGHTLFSKTIGIFYRSKGSSKGIAVNFLGYNCKLDQISFSFPCWKTESCC